MLKKIKQYIKKRRILCWFQSCKKIHAQKVIDKKVMEKCSFSTFTHVHQIGFLITFFVCIFCNFFNRSEISITFCVFWFYLIFFKQLFCGLISALSHFLQTFKLNPHSMAQKTEKRLFKIGVKFTCNIHICIFFSFF